MAMLRRLMVALGAVTAAVAAVLTADPADAAVGCTSSTASAGYKISVCLTNPPDGAVLVGKVDVTATVTVTGASSSVRISTVLFCLQAAPCSSVPGNYLLTDWTAETGGVYSFRLDSALLTDRTTSLHAYAVMNDGFASSSSSANVTFRN